MTSRSLTAFVVGAFASLALAGSAAHAAPIKVSCVGEQSTYTGHYAASMQWPELLQGIVGAGYVVNNDGDNTHASVLMDDSGATPVPYAGTSYANAANAAIANTGGGGYPRSLMSPDVVIIGPWGMHDTLTATSKALPLTQARFQTDYEFLVNSYLKLANKPKVYLTTPLALPTGGNVTAATQDYIKNAILPAVKAVAAAHNLTIIDLNANFPAADLVADGGLANPAGQMKMAQMMADVLTGGGSTDGGVTDAGGTKDAGAAGAGGAIGMAGTGGGTAGAGGAIGTAGTGGGTAGTGGGTTGTAGTGGGTTGTAGTGGGTTGAAGTGGGTTGTAGTGGMTTGAAGTGGTTTGAAGTGARSSGGGGCAVGGRSANGALASLLVALAMAIPAWRRRRR